MAALLALPFLAGLALLAGGLWLRRRDKARARLMLLAGAILLINVLLWANMPAAPGG